MVVVHSNRTDYKKDISRVCRMYDKEPLVAREKGSSRFADRSVLNENRGFLA